MPAERAGVGMIWKRVVGYGLIVIGWEVMRSTFGFELFSEQGVLVFLTFVLVMIGSDIVVSARHNQWPWNAP